MVLLRENGLLEIELSTLRPVLQTIVRAFSAIIVPYYCVSCCTSDDVTVWYLGTLALAFTCCLFIGLL